MHALIEGRGRGRERRKGRKVIGGKGRDMEGRRGKVRKGGGKLMQEKDGSRKEREGEGR